MRSGIDIVRELKRKAWKPTASQKALVSDRKIHTSKRAVPIILAWRSSMWIAGEPEDIKRGNYFVYGGAHFGKGPDEIYDFQHEYDGFCRGLDQNIHMTIGKSRVLVMDNHNFAAGFIIEMRKEGVISDHSSMAHVDRHDDFSGLWPGDAFNIKEYERLEKPHDKLRYLVTNTTIESWQRIPLFETGIVDLKRSKWAEFYHEEMAWKAGDYPIPGPGHYTRLNESSNSCLKDVVKGADIVDIDIDVLAELDKALSPQEKAMVSRSWDIPEKIRERFQELAELAVTAKVVTIATSPGFIAQDRAVIYVKVLLEMMRKLSRQA